MKSTPKNLLGKFKTGTPWIEDGTIFLAKHGSHAYGTSRPDSDLDIRGVAIPPVNYFLGFNERFNQVESMTDEIDIVIYDFRKFFKLASECNPNIIEILWIDEADWLYTTEAWETMVDHRDLFLSQRVKHTFSGYATSQLKRIKTHRQWLLNPVEVRPERKDFDLSDKLSLPKDELGAVMSMIDKKLDSWALDLTGMPKDQRIYLLGRLRESLVELYGDKAMEGKEGAAMRLIGLDDNLMHVVHRERQYNSAVKNWKNYQNWKKNRNKSRAELEKKFGYDSKHAMHLVRLLRMCREILVDGKVLVKRPDAEELLEIRNGAWPYEKLVEWAEEQDKELHILMKESKLPKRPNMERLDNLCMNIASDHLEIYNG